VYAIARKISLAWADEQPMIKWLASGRLAQIERFSIYNGHRLVYWTPASI
jgi:hypothetical protein